MEALDLSVRPPRSPYVKIGGLNMLARTIDKLRAELPGGKLGEYHFSGFSEQLLSELKIDHNELLAVVGKAASDTEVYQWVCTHSDEQRFEAISDLLQARILDASNRERLTKKYPVILQHPEVSRLFDVMILDDTEMFGHVSETQAGASRS